MTKTEHEKLKEICDEIGYKIYWYWFNKDILKWSILVKIIKKPNDEDVILWLNVREIIFTPKFMEKLDEYRFLKQKQTNHCDIKIALMHNLDNPVDYLYNLIFTKND